MFKDIVNKQGKSLYLLAKKSGISYTAINELYRGERNIKQCSGKTIHLLADALSISMDDLYDMALKRETIPISLYKCFWDAEPKNLDLKRDRIYIISRLLNVGGYEGYFFLNKAYEYEDFKYVGLNSRLLNPKTANYLATTYNIKKSDMKFYKTNINWR